MMKRFLSALAALLLCVSCAAGEETGKYDTLPEIFAITVEEAGRKIDNGGAYVYKEYVTTVNPEVNAALRALVDGYDEAISPTLEMDPRKKGKRGSALNIYGRISHCWQSIVLHSLCKLCNTCLQAQKVSRLRARPKGFPFVLWKPSVPILVGDLSVSKKWQTPLFRESKFGHPEVARICKELILQAKSTPSKALSFLKEKQRSRSGLAFRSKSQPSAGKAGLHE